MVDLTQFVTGGATRPDSLSGMQPEFNSSLAAMFAAAPPEVQQALRISSGYRSADRQAQLWQDALAKYGSPEAARKWVAPPGRSQHNHGNAADLSFATPEARQWAHANAGQYGLAFPLSNEAWHIEMANARGAGAPGAQPAPSAPVKIDVAVPAVAGAPGLAAAYAAPAQAAAAPTAGLGDLLAAQAERLQQRRGERDIAQRLRSLALANSLA